MLSIKEGVIGELVSSPSYELIIDWMLKLNLSKSVSKSLIYSLLYALIIYII
jgi:hypothetical protein